MRVHEALEQGTEGPLLQAGGARVDRDEAARVQRLVLCVLHDLIVVDAHLEGAAAAIGRLDLSVDDQALATLEDPRGVGLAEPAGAQAAGGVRQRDGQRDAWAGAWRPAHAAARARGRRR